MGQKDKRRNTGGPKQKKEIKTGKDFLGCKFF
jgi:hypothetical protein